MQRARQSQLHQHLYKQLHQPNKTRPGQTHRHVATQPKYRLLCDAMRHALTTGAVAKLPSIRELSEALAVTRKTVTRAYEQLAREGYLLMKPRQRPIVCALPRVAAQPKDQPHQSLRKIEDELAWPAGKVSLSTGVPDPRRVPTLEFARAYRRVWSKALTRHAMWDYGDPRGHIRLRKALARYLRDNRGIHVSHEEVFVTQGSQMGLYLALMCCERRAQVAVESPGYAPLWDAIEQLHLQRVEIAVDAEGVDVLNIPRSVLTLVTTPHHQYPTTVTLAAERRARLLQREEHGLRVIEDDYDHEFFYEAGPVAPLRAQRASVLHVGSFSKSVAPSIRQGYVVAPPDRILELARYRHAIDRQGNTAAELALAELLDDGTIERLQRRLRQVYGRRRTFLLDALSGLADFRCVAPTGGLCLWVSTRHAETIRKAALKDGYHVATASSFAPPHTKRHLGAGAWHGFRMSFARYAEGELQSHVKQLKCWLRK